MKYKNTPKLLAEEAWRMITDDCKEKMISLKEPYIKSLTEDISHFTNKIQDVFSIGFVEWVNKHENKLGYHEDMNKWYYYDLGKWVDTKDILEAYKKTLE